MTAEYSEAEQQVEITVLYNGPIFDPAESDNELSYTVLKNTTENLGHAAMNEDGFTNRFTCAIAEAR